MLNKNEKAVMKIIYNKTVNKDKSIIVTEEEIMSALPQKLKINLCDLRNILRQLAIDEYFELINSEKKGQPVLVITLTKNGEAFEREMIQQKRNIRQKLVITLICAIITAVVGLIIRGIFS